MIQMAPVSLVDNFYHYGFIRYSSQHQAIEYSELDISTSGGSSNFYTFNGTVLTHAFSIGKDLFISENYWYISYPSTGENIELSLDEKDSYFAELQYIDFVPITN